MIEPYYCAEGVTLYLGDCIEVMRQMPEASVDAVVCDPPYGLEFMGKEWDSFKGAAKFREPTDQDDERDGIGRGRMPDAYVAGQPFQAWCEAWAREAYRVLKPGGHLAAFGGTRTHHRLVCGIEDAGFGFEIRDGLAELYDGEGAVADFLASLDGHQLKDLQRALTDSPILMWMYGSGFPKSLDVSKAIDKLAGAEREVIGRYQPPNGSEWNLANESEPDRQTMEGGVYRRDLSVTAPATEDAQRWQGWGTALKPAHEPICLARKPLIGTVAANVLRHGTGALNIDGTRIATGDNLNGGAYSDGGRAGLAGDERDGAAAGMFAEGGGRLPGQYDQPLGRWPANVLLDEEAAALLDATVGERVSGSRAEGVRTGLGYHGANGDGGPAIIGSSGGPSRFFYTAKASRSEREAGLDDLPPALRTDGREVDADNPRLHISERHNDHPTVKPISVMRWLVRMVTPPGGVVLDPFLGSGTTGLAALDERMQFVGIDITERYVDIARYRVSHRHLLEVETRPASQDRPQGLLL